jgi:hypothetical protein
VTWIEHSGGKLRKPCPRVMTRPEELETLLPDDVDRVFKGKAEKALPRSDIPSFEEFGTLPSR